MSCQEEKIKCQAASKLAFEGKYYCQTCYGNKVLEWLRDANIKVEPRRLDPCGKDCYCRKHKAISS